MAREKAGQPTKYREEYCEQLIEHMATGMSFLTFAAVADVHEDTLYEWVKVHPEFSDAKRKAFTKNRAFWEGKGIEFLSSDKDGEKINATVWLFNMKNRFPREWRDRQDIVTRDETLKEPSDMTDDEIDERLAHALKVIEKHESPASEKPTTKRSKSNNKRSAKKKSTKKVSVKSKK